MAKTVRTYTGDGVRTLYPVDFQLGYLRREFVYVYLVNQEDDPSVQLDYVWQNDSQIELTTPVADGVEFKIRRIVPRDETINDYEDGAILRDTNLDDSFVQSLMILEEFDDGYGLQWQRALRVSESEMVSQTDLILPESRSNQIISFDTDGAVVMLPVEDVQVDSIFADVATMKTQSLPAGFVAQTTSYYGDNALDIVGGAQYEIMAPVDYVGTPDGFSDHVLANGNIARLIKNGVADLFKFGARGDGSITTAVPSDDTDAIQAVANSVASTDINESLPVYVPKGTFEITRQIDVPSVGRFVMFGDARQGAGVIRVSEELVDINTPILSMFSFANPSNIEIRNVSLLGSERAIDMLDFMQDQQGFAFGGRNILISQCRIHGIREGGTGINGLSWNTNVLDCDIAGYGDSYTPDTWQGTGIRIASSSNGCNIRNNYIRRLDVGIANNPSASIDCVTIDGNTMDFLRQTGVYFDKPIRLLNITNNYWEGVVRAEGVPIEVPVSSGTEPISAEIILATTPNDPVRGVSQVVNITGNNFIASYADSVIAISGIWKGNIFGNNVRYQQGGTHDEFVKIFGYGTLSGGRRQRSLLLDGNDLMNTRVLPVVPAVDRIITFDQSITTGNRDYMEGIVVKDTIYDYSGQLTTLLDASLIQLLRASTQYDTGWLDREKTTIKHEKVIGGGFNVAMDLSEKLTPLRGNYFRVEFESQTSQAGIRPRIEIDDGVNVTLVEGGQSQVGVDVEFSVTDFPVYIDVNATKLDVTISHFSSEGEYILLKEFNLVPIWMDLRTSPVNKETKLTAQPDFGYWVNGDFVQNLQFNNFDNTTDSVFGWACTNSGDTGVNTWTPVFPLTSVTANDEIAKDVFDTYTLFLTDAGKTLKASSDVTPNVLSLTQGFSSRVGYTVMYIKKGDAPTSIVAPVGVTINGVDGATVEIADKWKGGSLTLVAPDEWQWLGDGEAV